MGRISIGEKLRQNFSSADKKSWTEIAKTEVNGNEPFNFLAHEDDDKIKFFPYYEKSALASFHFLQSFILPPSSLPYQSPRAWVNMPIVLVDEAASANTKALDHLSQGADGVVFDFAAHPVNVGMLLKDIQPQYCSLGFKGMSPDHLAGVEAVLHEATSRQPFGGFVFWDDVPIIRSGAMSPAFKRCSIIVEPSTPVKEIAAALIKGVSTFEAGAGKSQIDFEQIAFSLTIGDSFLHQVAKIKALRILWYQVARAYGFATFEFDALRIHAFVRKREGEYDPHGNMLRTTNGAMAAVIGGCNALTVEPDDPTNPTMNRIARNVSSILREESFFDKVSDPLAGAYTVDAIVQSLCEKAWAEFQTLVK